MEDMIEPHVRQWSIVRSVGPLYGPGRQRLHAGRLIPRNRTSLGRPLVILGSAVGGRSGGRTRCALLTRYAFGDDTIGSRGFIAAVTPSRTAVRQ
jgi:hypothetical protein